MPVASPLLQADAGGSFPQLSFSPDSGMGRILAAAKAAAGEKMAVQPIFSSHLASVLTAMARDGRGVAWSPLSLVDEDLSSHRLVHAGDEGDDVPMEIRLWRPRARQSPAAEALWARLLKGEGSDAAPVVRAGLAASD